jgi:16S rRNA (guanine966-N2)-methyltransferase
VMPAGEATRPTAARAREGLFSTLTALCGDLAGLSFLDLYAGSGAVGLEAASRGASRVLLVEREPKALRAAASNIDTLALSGVELRADSVERTLAAAPPEAFDIAFLDPPYSEPVEGVVGELVTHGWLAQDAVVCVERATREGAPAWPTAITPLRARKYGEGTLWYGRRS